MKLIIDIPEKIVTAIQNGEDYRYDIHTAIAQGMPYEERTGEWVKDYIGQVNSFCSRCDYEVGKITNFCPNCGAKMRGKK